MKIFFCEHYSIDKSFLSQHRLYKFLELSSAKIQDLHMETSNPEEIMKPVDYET
jgi:hypothetical protein